MSADRDELADLLDDEALRRTGRSIGMLASIDVANAVRASDWLAKVKAEAAAEALERIAGELEADGQHLAHVGFLLGEADHLRGVTGIEVPDDRQ